MNRFDVCEAYYWFAVTCHTGQNSPEYKIFGRLQKIGFKPTPSIERGQLGHEAAVIYERLVASHKPDGCRHCACRDCFEITLGAFCHVCESAECGLNRECCADDGYKSDPDVDV